MSTWEHVTLCLRPQSYRNLVMRWVILRQTKSDLSRGGALRYTLRRLRFQDEQKRAYKRAVERALPAEGRSYTAILEALVDELEQPEPAGGG